MINVFDGFIAAVSTETRIPFEKEEEGRYRATVSFANGRKQNVLVLLDKDDMGDPTINYYSIICDLETDDVDLFKTALQLNVSLTYGSVALLDGSLIVHHTYFLNNLDPQRFIKSLLYVAAKADELEEVLIEQDKN